jgi:hypothetical protein
MLGVAQWSRVHMRPDSCDPSSLELLLVTGIPSHGVQIPRLQPPQLRLLLSPATNRITEVTLTLVIPISPVVSAPQVTHPMESARSNPNKSSLPTHVSSYGTVRYNHILRVRPQAPLSFLGKVYEAPSPSANSGSKIRPFSALVLNAAKLTPLGPRST